MSSPGKASDLVGMSFIGCIQIQKGNRGSVRLDVQKWKGEARFDLSRIPLEKVLSVRAVDPTGNPVPDVSFLREGQEWVLRSSRPVKTVWLSDTIQGGDRNLLP
jgi:hypothetical protein